MNEKNIRWIILALLAIPILAAIWFCDSLYAGRDQSKLDQCKFQLKAIHTGYVSYKNDHGGAPPKKFQDIKFYIFGQDQTFSCPSGQPGANYEPPFGVNPAQYVYDYSSHPRPGGDMIICCDHEPHMIRHFVLRFMDQKVREVLYADGRIATMPESEFQALDPNSKPTPHK
ncbi:MAG: hypothetical protein JWQ02_519 [Capsulimonas sp.]|nr:hypothetical protein [Capsulimonas sp.]